MSPLRVTRVAHHPSHRRATFRLAQLEDRAVPTIFTVTNTNDSGVGSLRQAVIDANTLAGQDTVVFDPNVFGVPQIISLATGQLTITSSLTITGPGAGLLTVKNTQAEG